MQAIASGVGPVSMQYIDHLAKQSAVFGPGTMFLFAACVQMIAVGFAWALPKDRSNSTGSSVNSSGLPDSFFSSVDWSDEEEGDDTNQPSQPV